MQGEARLAGPTRAGERQQADVRPRDQRLHFLQLTLPAEKRRCGDREIRLVQRLQGRKVGVAELVEPLRCGEVLQAVLTEIAEAVVAGEVARRLAEEDLAAVAGCGDPSRAVDVQPDVALIGDHRLTRVQSHSNAHRTAVERLPAIGGCCERILDPDERNEEGVALGIHLDAAVACEGFPQDAAVLGQRVCVSVAELVQQPSRALDVGEEERDGAGRELAHLLEGWRGFQRRAK